MPLRDINKDTILYLGAMTGTSVDKEADFTVASFHDNGQLRCHENIAIAMPKETRSLLYRLSVTPSEHLTLTDRSIGEIAITRFLIDAFQEVIQQAGLSDHPKENLILSPHGQTIDHQPTRSFTDQLLHGEQLAYETQHPVVFRHRQSCITCSNAAPLAPVLLGHLFNEKRSATEDVVIVNGGGIANICIFSGDKTIAFDTGPANGPLDEWMQHLLTTDSSLIPNDLSAEIMKQAYDVGGQWAKRGQVNEAMYARLMRHPYFADPSIRKSADRAWFNLQWVLDARGHTEGTDSLTTLAAVVADSLANSLLKNLSTPTIRIGFYGGLRYHQYVIERVLKQLEFRHLDLTLIHWESMGLDPDFIESLLMAYLGFCVHQKKRICLDYCSTHNASDEQKIKQIGCRVMPGLLIDPQGLQ